MATMPRCPLCHDAPHRKFDRRRAEVETRFRLAGLEMEPKEWGTVVEISFFAQCVPV